MGGQRFACAEVFPGTGVDWMHFGDERWRQFRGARVARSLHPCHFEIIDFELGSIAHDPSVEQGVFELSNVSRPWTSA